jgi:VCBS repeat-containing protein
MVSETGSNAVALTADWGIDAATSRVYDDSGQTETSADITATATEAENDGLSVMFRPLIDFTYDASQATLTSPNGTVYADGDWRAYYNPGSISAFFTSYDTMMVGEAKEAQAAGVQILDIGTEIDQLTGPQYATQWNKIISNVKAAYTGKLTYSAIWDDDISPWQYGGTGLSAGTGDFTTQINFWSPLDYVGIDEYAAISDAANPTLQDLINGWEDAPTDPTTSAVTGGLSLIQYYENLSTALDKPLLFTELGYNSAPDAAEQPFYTSSSTYDPALQNLLYEAFIDAWEAQGNTSLQGVYLWDWEPDPSNVGAGVDPSWTPQGNTGALQTLDAAFSGGPVTVVAEMNEASVAGREGTPTLGRGTAGTDGTGALAGDSDANGAALTITAIEGGTVGTSFGTQYGALTLNADGSYLYSADASKLANAPIGAPTTDTITFTVSDSNGATANSTLAITDYRDPTAVAEVVATGAGGTVAGTAGTGGTGALAGDSDPDRASLSVVAIDDLGEPESNPIAGSYGTLTLNSDGSYSYTADSAAALASAFSASNGQPLHDGFTLEVAGALSTFALSSLTITVSEAAGQPAPRDFTGDGTSDILWQSSDGNVDIWQMSGGAVAGSAVVGFAGPSAWHIKGTGDFNGDGKADMLWQDSDGNVAVWQMNGLSVAASAVVGFADPTSWNIVATGDFTGDGSSDILWQDTDGNVDIWQMNDGTVAGSAVVGFGDPSAWHVEGTGDFNGDGKSDILWGDSDGNVAIWEMNGFSVLASTVVGFADPSNWHIAGIGDYNGDGKSDILWQDTGGNVDIWQMNGLSVAASALVGFADPASWNIVPPDSTGAIPTASATHAGAGAGGAALPSIPYPMASSVALAAPSAA